MSDYRQILVGSGSAKGDLGTFLTRALRLDESAVIRARNRGPKHFTVWTQTGFGVLAARTIPGRATPADLVAAADHLLHNLRGAHGYAVDPGYSLDSAWRGALPADQGYEHVDDIPASLIVELAEQGSVLAREHGSQQGPPTSLLDQHVVTASSDNHTVGITMRSAFAIVGMGFVPKELDDDEKIRVRASGVWTRVDARFGSIFIRRNSLQLFTN
ncbi:hypothetical protein IEU95_14875 [Hoyosella rhizosphaerae]|uniref:Uncharacterized protein n=1 Tax=Hoyosella rhizosphaerae TaxID=1755582 RepID=A0A916XGX5_9ACTN|nr:hypothetical protein [Hoyosella rhizosphaerae]MBN4928121.1 hypothetical protein [Hoyosella rhizosphaerae]GGC72535.1 hypothetical protein GCM10011410_27020 [Hoyosella rhizosphaerae]